MILKKEIDTVAIAVTGTLHAVVSVNQGDEHQSRAIARLNRAFAQIEREYGIKLSFSPYEPTDKTFTEAGCEWLKKKIQDDIYMHLPEPPEPYTSPQPDDEWDDEPLIDAILEIDGVDTCEVWQGDSASALAGVAKISVWRTAKGVACWASDDDAAVAAAIYKNLPRGIETLGQSVRKIDEGAGGDLIPIRWIYKDVP